MRVALVVPGFSKNADDWAIPALQSLALKLNQSHQVVVFSLRYPAAGHYQLSSLHHLATGGGQRGGARSLAVVWRTLGSIIRYHRKQPFDIVHAFWADEPGLVAVIAGSRLGLPSIVSLGGGELTYFPDIGYGTQGSMIRSILIRLTLRRATALTAGSRYQAALTGQMGARPDEVRLIPLGVDSNRFTLGEPPPSSRPTIMQAASLTPVKNQVLLLELLSNILPRIPKIILRLVGNGPLQVSLQHIAKESNLLDHIVWQGDVSHPEMPAQYHQAHIYVQTSRHESQGMSVLEAMACGLPAIGTPVGILPEVSIRPATADPALLAAQAWELLSDRERLLELRQPSRDTITNMYTLEHAAGKFTSLYQLAIG